MHHRPFKVWENAHITDKYYYSRKMFYVICITVLTNIVKFIWLDQSCFWCRLPRLYKCHLPQQVYWFQTHYINIHLHLALHMRFKSIVRKTKHQPCTTQWTTFKQKCSDCTIKLCKTTTYPMCSVPLLQTGSNEMTGLEQLWKYFPVVPIAIAAKWIVTF